MEHVAGHIPASRISLNRLAISATTHCLTGCAEALFYASIAAGFAIAYPFAFIANRYMIARGKGHAVVHQYHGH
jgi:hypothetical protein